MAEDRYRWLDADTAERLLRGAAAVPDDAADPLRPPERAGEAETAARLAATLRALVPPAPAAGAGGAGATEDAAAAAGALPGEEAALAAFRAARADRDGHPRSEEHPAPTAPSDPGRVAGAWWRALRPRGLARPLRAGCAVGLLGCALGGVAFAAQTGVLPAPFGGTPSDAGSASVASPRATGDGASREPRPSASRDVGNTPDPRWDDGPSASPSTPGSHRPGDRDAREEGAADGTPSPGPSGRALVELCVRYQDGTIAAVELTALRRAAGGADAVPGFCAERVADGSDASGGTGGVGGVGGSEGTDEDPGDGRGTPPADTGGSGAGADEGSGDRGDDGGGHGRGDAGEEHTSQGVESAPRDGTTERADPTDTPTVTGGGRPAPGPVATVPPRLADPDRSDASAPGATGGDVSPSATG